MVLKGVMTLELTDENTGAVETVTEENMITEAVNNILGLNPMGIFYAATGEYDAALLWNGNLLPICPNMIGGILLFSKTLAEDEELLYESSDNLPVAYASNDVNSTANLARGSLNLTESMAISNGYKFVWEFTPNQGNGTIAAVALTSALKTLRAYHPHRLICVFGSVGVGTLKGWDAAKNRMIHITEFDRREARIIARGPVRTVVEMAVEGWRYGGRRIGMVSRYILYAGHSDVQVENSITGDCDGLLFTTGVMKMAGNSFLRMGNAMAAVGCDFPENDTLKWERERVALAVAVPAGQVRADAEDKTSYLWLLAPDEHGHIDYVFDMWWRKSRWLEGVSDEAMLTGVLDAVRRAASPVRVERLR